MKLAGVVGIAQGIHRGRPCILVLAAVASSELTGKLPKEIEGYPVRIEETGDFRARGDKSALK